MYMYVVPRGPRLQSDGAPPPVHKSFALHLLLRHARLMRAARVADSDAPQGGRLSVCCSAAPSALPALGSQFPAVHAHRERDRNFLSSSAGNGPGRTYARYERWKEGRKKSLHPLYFTLLHRSLSESAQSDVRDARRRERCTAEGTGRARLDIESAFCCSYALCGGVMSS
jgi:hypothetical protein